MKNNNESKILYIMLVLSVFFFPTSMNGIIFDSNLYTLIYYLLSIALILWYVFTAKITKKRFLSISVLLIVTFYMLVASAISISVLGGYLSVARIASFTLILILLLFDSEKSVSLRFALKINEILTIIIIIWNIGIIMDFSIFRHVTISAFSQFNWFTTMVFVNKGTPVFTFGIYSYGAIFYALLSMFWLQVCEFFLKTNQTLKKRYVIYFCSHFLFLIMLNGSTSYLLTIVVVITLMYKLRKTRYFLSFTTMVVILIGSFILVSDVDWNRIVVGTTTNGFFVRYLTNWFHYNYVAIKETFLGIGYTIPSKYPLIFSDSGYIVLFTMGGVVAVGVIYYNLLKSLKRNVSKDYVYVIFIIIMLFELSLPGLLYIKQIIFIAYFYLSMRPFKMSAYDYIEND